MPEISKDDLFVWIGREERREKDLLRFANSDVSNREYSRPFISKNTLHKYKIELMKEGKLKKGWNENGHVVYFIPEEYYSELEALKQRQQLRFELDLLTPKEIEEVLKELKILRREKRIKELEEMSLPANAVYDKLNDLGFTSDDLLPYLNDEIKYSIAIGSIYDRFTADDVEIELIPEEKYTGESILILKFGPWVLLSTKPIKGYFIRVIYKELLRLYDEQFEDDLLQWKEKFDFRNDEWVKVKDTISEMMEDGYDPWEIDNFLIKHILSLTPEGQRRWDTFRKSRLESINKPQQQVDYLTKEEIKKYLELARNN